MEEKTEYQYIDEEDFEVLVRYIKIMGKGIKVPYLDMGLTATEKLYNLAKDGKIKNAESIKIEWEYNCDIVFKGSELIKFLQEYYPEYLDKNSNENDIDPNENYQVSAFDYS